MTELALLFTLPSNTSIIFLRVQKWHSFTSQNPEENKISQAANKELGEDN